VGQQPCAAYPKSFAEEAGLKNSSPVDVSLVDGRLVIAPVRKPKWTLNELLAQVTPDNLHGEVDTGPATGNESW
jgi:antitoxin MazE